MTYSLKCNFNVLTGPVEVTYSWDQIQGTDLERYYLSLVSQRQYGVIGATYNMPQYGRVELNLVEAK